MQKTIFLSSMALVGMLAATGCSTMFNGPVTDIQFTANGVDQAECYVENRDYKNHVLVPGVLRVENSSKPLNVTCEKMGYETTAFTIESSVQPIQAANVLNAGLGAIVDEANHAIYEYPETVEVRMVPLNEANQHSFTVLDTIVTKDTFVLKDHKHIEIKRPTTLTAPLAPVTQDPSTAPVSKPMNDPAGYGVQEPTSIVPKAESFIPYVKGEEPKFLSVPADKDPL